MDRQTDKQDIDSKDRPHSCSAVIKDESKKSKNTKDSKIN